MRRVLSDGPCGQHKDANDTPGPQARFQLAVLPHFMRAAAEERNRGSDHGDVALGVAVLIRAFAESFVHDRSPGARAMLAEAIETVWSTEPTHSDPVTIPAHARQ